MTQACDFDSQLAGSGDRNYHFGVMNITARTDGDRQAYRQNQPNCNCSRLYKVYVYSDYAISHNTQ